MNQSCQIITPIYPLKTEEIHDPNIVKALFKKNNEAIYFSRAALPYNRCNQKDEWYKEYQYWGHVGIYCYRADFLSKWDEIPKSKLEEIEKLEQLRFIDSGHKINIFKTNYNTISVDDSKQLEEVREIIRLEHSQRKYEFNN